MTREMLSSFSRGISAATGITKCLAIPEVVTMATRIRRSGMGMSSRHEKTFCSSLGLVTKPVKRDIVESMREVRVMSSSISRMRSSYS